MSSKYLSIADFAETAGISKQAVYQRLNTESLKPFIAIVDGKKAISSDALKFFKVESIENKATIKDLLNQISILNQKLDSINNELSTINSKIDSIVEQPKINKKSTNSKEVEQERGQSNDIQSTLNNATDKLGRPKPKRETRIYKGVPVPVVRVVAMGRDGNTGKPRTGCRAAGHDGKVLTAYQHEGETDQECMDRWADIYLSRIAQENNK